MFGVGLLDDSDSDSRAAVDCGIAAVVHVNLRVCSIQSVGSLILRL